MPKCDAIREQLTAWIDGALPPRASEKIRGHIAGCAACAAESRSLQTTIATQQRLLSHAVGVEDYETAPLRFRLQRALAVERVRETEDTERSWGWLFRPLAIAGAVAASALILALSFAGGPTAVLIPLGVEAPPAKVSRAPEMFKEYPIIQQLDALENYDTVESTPLDDEQGSQNG